ncbi:MAG: shikimate dehydrogenase family protein, partial [bacterium]
AVVYTLAQAGARVHIYARRPAQAQQLVADLGSHLQDPVLVARPWDALAHAGRFRAPLVVNTTPVGMYPHVDASPWPGDTAFPSGAVLYDLIYNPRQTRLMQQAQAAGCLAINGLGMLLQQGALAFEIWMGVRPPLEVMEAEIGD